MDQAGLGSGVAPAGAGLNEPLTMEDRGAAIRALMQSQNLSFQDAARAVGAEPIRAPVETGQPAPDVEAAGPLDMLVTGAQRMLGGAISGAGAWTEDTEIEAGAREIAGYVGPTVEQEAASQKAYQDRADRAAMDEIGYVRHLAGDIGQAVVESSPYFVGGAGAGAVTAKAADVLGRTVSPLVTNTALGRVALKTIEALPGGRRLNLKNPEVAKRVLKWAGFGAGAGAFGTAGYYEMGMQRAEAEGLDTSDPEVRDAIANQAYVRGGLETLSFLGIFGKIGAVTPRVQSAFRAFMGGGIKGGGMEGTQELADMAIEDAFLNPETVKRLDEGGLQAVTPWLVDMLGSREAAVAFLAGAGVGGPVGATVDARRQQFTNMKAANEVRTAARVLEPMGLGTQELEELSKTKEGATKLREAVEQIGRVERARSANLRQIDEAGADEEIVKGLREQVNTQLDDRIDQIARTLGAPKTLEEVRKERTAWEKQRQRAAAERLAERGLRPQKDLSANVAEQVAARIERSEGEVERLQTRLEATTNPERRAETQADLNAALEERQQARIDARIRAEGMTPTQALQAVQRAERQTDAERRREAQRGARERAIERQTEIEMPETMAPEARVKRAQEIIAEAEADVRPDAGLDGKIKRLERQRRAATSPEDVDRLSDEIADLEARRGLPTPAVEAARRVLQAQGVEIPQGVMAPGPVTRSAVDAGLLPEEAATGPGGAATSSGPRTTVTRDEAQAIRLAPDRASEVAIVEQALTDRGVADPVRRKRAIEAYSRARDVRADGDTADVSLLGALQEAVAPKSASNPFVAAPQVKRSKASGPVGFDIEGGNPFTDLSSEMETGSGIEKLEASMLEWSKETGFEVGAHVNEATGEVLGVGTNSTVNAVMPPRAGLNDPAIAFTHTHTENTPLSAADVRAMLISGQKFRAVLPDGTITAAQPLKPFDQGAFFRIFRAVRERLAETLPPDMPFVDRAQIRQEAFLHAMEGAGFIRYTTPFRGLTQTQKDYVNDTSDAIAPILRSAAAPVRAGTDGRAGASQSGEPGGQVGERRAADAEAGAGVQDVEFEIPLEAEDDWDPEGIDFEDAILGQYDDRSSVRNKRPSYNAERVGELADKIIENVLSKGAKLNGAETMVRDGTVSRDQLIAGIGEYLRSDGRKQMYTIIDVRRAIFKGQPITFDMLEHAPDNRKGRAVKAGTKVWKVKTEHQGGFKFALDLERMIGEAGFGGINRVENRFAAKNDRFANKTYFLNVSPQLARHAELVPPQGMYFDPPMKDPNDTSRIKRNRTNRLSKEGIDVARRTARYLQANQYTIDKGRLDSLTPDDLISGKSFARDGIKPDVDMPRWEALKETLPPGYDNAWLTQNLTKEDADFVRSVGWKIEEKRRDAARRLKQLRQAYAIFVEKNGPDAKVGFLYQIDDRGRIYADGAFHPQSDVKNLFVYDGMNLEDDMITVDASASGWQINALMARDHVAAPFLNLGRGQATQEGYIKSDLYMNTLRNMRERLMRDAAAEIPADLKGSAREAAVQRKRWAQQFLDVIFPSSDEKSWLLDRAAIKPAIIAMNYGGLEKNFRRVLTKVLSTRMKKATNSVPLGEGAWSYLTEAGMEGIERTAPHALALERWAMDSIAAVSRALTAKYGADAPTIDLTIGLDGTIGVKRSKSVETETRIKQVSAGKETEVTTKFRVAKPEVDHDAIKKAVWANLVQSYDAAVLHRAVERYKKATNGAYITTNHDSFTVPPEHEGAIASAVRESMRTIMEQVDVPNLIFEELDAMIRREGLDVNIDRFTNMGQYNYDDIMTSTPVFGEGGGRPDNFVPDYAELPEEGAELRRAVDEVPEGGGGAAAPGPSPARLPVGEQGMTPEVRRAIDVADYMASLPQSRSLLTRIQDAMLSPKVANRTLWEIIEDTFFNAAAPIRRLEVALKGKLPDGAESAFKAVEMAVQDSGRQEAMLYYGAAAFGPHGEYTIAPGTMGLFDIFKLASGDGAGRGQRLQDWMQWMVARRASDLNARGIKTPLTPQDIQTALAKGASIPEFQQAADAWKKFNDANLDFLEQSGRISAAQKAAMQADDFYVPFYRSDERVDGTSPDLELPEYKAGNTKAGVLSRDPGIKAIKGGDTLRIDNLMQNMIRNSQAIQAAGMRNRAANQTFDLMKMAGLATVQPLTAKKPDPNAVRVWQNGVESWLVPEGREAYPLMLALAGMQPVQQGRAMRFMTDMANIFRQGITLTPPFMIRNAIRGAVSSGIMTTGANLTTTNNTITGFREAYNNGQAAQAFKAQSGMGDYRFGNSDVGFGKDDILIDFGLMDKTVGSRFRKFMEKMEHVGSATELADRLAARETMIKNGMRPDEASYQALTIMNYSRKGNSQTLRALLPLVPFLNARLQGLSRMAEGAVGKRGALGRKQALMQMALNGLVYSALGGAIWLWNASDDERREKYAQEPLYRRLNFHIVYAGDLTLYIPKAFELGHLFTSIPELFADAMIMKDMNEAGSTGWGQVGVGLKKIAYDTVAMNLIPSAVLPTLEALTNYSFFRQAEIEGQREQDMLPADRTSGASMLSRLVGRDLGVSEFAGISPTMIEHWLSSHGGIYYTMLSTAVEIAAGDLDLAPVRPGGAFGDTPLISPALNAAFGSMVKDSAVTPSRFVEEYYKTKDYITQVYRSATNAARGGDIEYARRLLSEFGGTAAAYKLMNRAGTELTDISTALRMLRDDRTMSREQKRAREAELIGRRNELTRKVMEVVRGIEDKQGAKFSQGQGALSRILP